jgi:phospholipase/lecithinase/hemolysin
VKNLFQSAIAVLLFGLAVLPTQAFNSLYVFGDALSATADNPAPGPAADYYQNHDSNGRIWIEVLAQRQGLTYDASKNTSYYDHNSSEVVTDVKNFIAPPDVANDLFIVWVCNADTFDAAQVPDNSTQWQAANNQSQANHLQIITQLYAKGVRTLVLPNAVDISEIPAFNVGTKQLTTAEHAGCIDFNLKFSNTINQALALCPGLTIYAPDFYTLLNNVLTNAASYGLTNALSSQGLGIDALDSIYTNNAKVPVVLNGPGTNYVFWDSQDPTAEFHEVIADVVQQIISPVQISQLTVLNGSNRLDVINMPVGLNGFVKSSTNLAQANWTTVTNFNSTTPFQSIFVNAAPLPPAVAASGSGGSTDPNNPVSGTYFPPFNPAQFYQLSFPYAWSWP